MFLYYITCTGFLPYHRGPTSPVLTTSLSAVPSRQPASQVISSMHRLSSAALGNILEDGEGIVIRKKDTGSPVLSSKYCHDWVGVGSHSVIHSATGISQDTLKKGIPTYAAYFSWRLLNTLSWMYVQRDTSAFRRFYTWTSSLWSSNMFGDLSHRCHHLH